MHPLDLFPFLSATQERLVSQVTRITEAETVSLIVEPELSQIIAAAFIEAALLDTGMRYSRVLRGSASDEQPSKESLCIHFVDETEIQQPSILTMSSVSIEIGSGREPRARTGVLDRVAVAGIIALLLSPEGPRVRRMLPQLLVGNWLRQSLDLTYDIVFTALRDSLLEKRLVTVHTIAEVEQIDLVDLPGIDTGLLRELQNTWNELDLELRAERLSTIAEPLLEGVAGTARLEELIWHRLCTPESKSDLASQCSQARRLLSTCASDERILRADSTIDCLIRNGTLL